MKNEVNKNIADFLSIKHLQLRMKTNTMTKQSVLHKIITQNYSLPQIIKQIHSVWKSRKIKTLGFFVEHSFGNG